VLPVDWGRITCMEVQTPSVSAKKLQLRCAMMLADLPTEGPKFKYNEVLQSFLWRIRLPEGERIKIGIADRPASQRSDEV
jgi:hypothetical protein